MRATRSPVSAAASPSGRIPPMPETFVTRCRDCGGANTAASGKRAFQGASPSVWYALVATSARTGARAASASKASVATRHGGLATNRPPPTSTASAVAEPAPNEYSKVAVHGSVASATHEFGAPTLSGSAPPRIPVPAPGERHHRGHDQCPDQGRIDQYRDAQPEPDHFQHRQCSTHERSEHHHHDQAGSRDHRSHRGETLDRSAVTVRVAVILLLDAKQQEQLVVHREPEAQAEHHERNLQRDGRNRVLESYESIEPPELEHRDHRTHAGGHGEQVHEHRLDG